MTANLAWVGGQARTRSGDDAGDAFVDRGSERAELALGRLRSAEPRLGQLGGAPPVGGQRGLDTERSPRRRAGERLDLVEGHAGVFADGGFHDAARLLLEIVHARGRMAARRRSAEPGGTRRRRVSWTGSTWSISPSPSMKSSMSR